MFRRLRREHEPIGLLYNIRIIAESISFKKYNAVLSTLSFNDENRTDRHVPLQTDLRLIVSVTRHESHARLLCFTNYFLLTLLQRSNSIRRNPLFIVVLNAKLYRILYDRGNNIYVCVHIHTYIYILLWNDLNDKSNLLDAEKNRCKSSTERLDIRVIKKSTYLYVFYAIMTR